MQHLEDRKSEDLSVSVILPLFGNHRGIQTIMIAVDSWLEQDVPCEVIVALGGDVRLEITDGRARKGRLKIVQSRRHVAAASPLRNLGARAAEGDLVYHSDADIAPLRSDFLSRAIGLMQEPGKRVVAHPWMYRLISVCPPRPLSWQPPAGMLACYVTVDKEGRLMPVPGEQFDWRGCSPLVVPPNGEMGLPDQRGGRRVATTHHGGGVLLEKEVFEEVGGFCTEYVGWGCQDHDLLVKLSGRRRIVQAWRADRILACLHFEHPHPYGGPTLAANRRLLAQRKAMGAEAMIRADTRTAVDTDE